MSQSIGIKPEYGYVVLVGAASYFVHHMYMAFKVVKARKKFGVSYPALYADKDNCPDESKCKAFNCVQRGHQNSLENYPSFLALLFSAGILHPVTSAGLGAAYLVGRIMYFEGYATGSPDKRLMAAPVMYTGAFGLLITAIKVGINMTTRK